MYRRVPAKSDDTKITETLLQQSAYTAGTEQDEEEKTEARQGINKNAFMSQRPS